MAYSTFIIYHYITSNALIIFEWKIFFNYWQLTSNKYLKKNCVAKLLYLSIQRRQFIHKLFIFVKMQNYFSLGIICLFWNFQSLNNFFWKFFENFIVWIRKFHFENFMFHRFAGLNTALYNIEKYVTQNDVKRYL